MARTSELCQYVALLLQKWGNLRVLGDPWEEVLAGDTGLQAQLASCWPHPRAKTALQAAAFLMTV